MVTRYAWCLAVIILLCTLNGFAQAGKRVTPIRKQIKQQHPIERDPVFKFIGKLTFEGKVVRGSIHKSEIDSLLARRVDIGGNPSPYGKYGLGFTYQEGKLPAFSCQEWAQARMLGLDSELNTYERTMESFFKDTCGFLYALKDAKPAKRSFIANPQVGLSNISLLPVTMLHTLSGDHVEGFDEATARKVRISQLVAKRKAKVLQRTASALALEYAFEPERKAYGYRMNFDERARADFDGDGIEDIFISSAWYVTEGTFRAYDYFLLTRRSPAAGFEIKKIELPAIKENPEAKISGLELKSSQLTKMKITKQAYGKNWPFNEEKGELTCAKAGSVAVFFTTNGTTYPLNAWARSSKIDGVAVASDTHDIENGESLSAIFNRAFAMCRTKEGK
jgi:hypothetical protein